MPHSLLSLKKGNQTLQQLEYKLQHLIKDSSRWHRDADYGEIYNSDHSSPSLRD